MILDWMWLISMFKIFLVCSQTTLGIWKAEVGREDSYWYWQASWWIPPSSKTWCNSFLCVGWDGSGQQYVPVLTCIFLGSVWFFSPQVFAWFSLTQTLEEHNGHPHIQCLQLWLYRLVVTYLQQWIHFTSCWPFFVVFVCLFVFFNTSLFILYPLVHV